MVRKTVTLTVVLAGACALAPAQMVTDSNRGEFSLGASQTDSNTLSSKFLEYRDIPNGLFSPQFRFSGEKNAFRYDVFGLNVRQKDQAFRGFLENDVFRLSAAYAQIPHSFGNDGHTLLNETDPGVWQLSNTLQQAFQNALPAVTPARSGIAYTCDPRPSSISPTVACVSLLDLVSPSLAAVHSSVDLRLTRERGNIAFALKPEPFDLNVTYFRERRVGSRAASGTSFGFGNVVELPEPVHYLTQDFAASGQVSGSWGSARAGVRYNWFANRISTMSWDNPFRATDSTDSSAYSAPGSGSIGGAAVGTMALPPDNDALTGSLGATLKLGRSTRIIADASYGQWQQNETPFIPYTTNTAIVSPIVASDIRTLPAARLDGKIDVKSLSTMLTSRPAAGLTFTARYRLYDLENKTPQIRFPGYVRFEGVWEDIPRVSVPYAYKNQRADASLAYDFGPVTLEGGVRTAHFDRHFRETEKTKENAFNLAASVRANGWVNLRTSYERSERDYDGLEIELSEEASFQIHSAPANVFAIPSTSPIYTSLCGSGPVCNLRYDQAKKTTDRVSTAVTLTPGGGKVALMLGYGLASDDYAESRFGLLKARFETMSGELSFTPDDKTSLYGFYSYERVRNDQRGRQSGATVSTNLLDDWTSDVRDRVHSIGGGGDFTLVPEKWFLNVSGRWQRVDGSNDISAAPGGAPYNARAAVGGVLDIPLYDDTELLTINTEVKYQFAKSWSAAVGGFFEDYRIRDSNTVGLMNYVPGSFFLAAVDGDYRATVGYVRLTYRW
jgi:MtrB/PioB family decaheme-associated outer membrane protein